MSQNISFSAYTATSSPYRYMRQLAAVILGTAVLTLSAYMTVRLPPVPVSMENFAVVMVGALYGWRLGGITIVAWLLEGALGMPVLAGGSGGIMCFFGPTGGYLFSYPLVGALAGWLVARGWDGSRPLLAFCAMGLANALCLLLGAAWLAVLIGPANAFASGVAPFIPGDFLKAILAALTLGSWYSVKRNMGRE